MEQEGRDDACWTVESKIMTECSGTTAKYKMWYTQDELSKKLKESHRCCEIEEGLLKFIVLMAASLGSPHDVTIRLFF